MPRPALHVFSLFLLFQTHSFSAQPSAQLEALLKQAFGSEDLRLKSPGPFRWLEGGTAYTLVEDGEIIRIDAASGVRSTIVSKEVLTLKGKSEPMKIGDYAWSDDRKQLLIFTNTKRVWRQDTRGDYWLLELGSGALRRIGGDAPEASLMFAKFSPDGRRVGYVLNNDIYVEELKSGKTVRLTWDGSPTSINGTSDWVNEEELNIRDGFRWSPDSKRIALFHFDSTGVGDFVLVNNTDDLYPKLTHLPYPKAGTTNSAVKVGVVSVEGGNPTWMNLPGEPRQHYLSLMEWAGNSEQLVIYQLNRLQNVLQIYLAQAEDGKAVSILRETDEAFVEVRQSGSHRWLDKGKTFLWLSERDGWRHAWRISRDGQRADLVTKFEGDILSISEVDEKGGWLYFIASPSNATQRYLHRARLDGSGSIERITPSNLAGTNQYQVAPDAKLAMHTYSTFDRPPAYDVVSLPAHEKVREVVDNKSIEKKVESFGAQPVEFFQVKAGTYAIDGWLLKPQNFDPSKNYPVLVYVYGEPANVTVTDAFAANSHFHRALASEGFLVVSFDNRGTPAPKGSAWRRTGYGAIGRIAADDQAVALKQLLAERPYIDPKRIAVWGWSGGGSNTLNAMFRYPELYKAGMSVAPVPDQTLYDTIYMERYMKLPEENKAGYQEGSPIHFAQNLSGPLLLVHGTGDDNVHYQGTERLINRLVELGKPFEMIAYPNRSHAISEGKGTSIHLRLSLARFLLRNVEPGPRPRVPPDARLDSPVKAEAP